MAYTLSKGTDENFISIVGIHKSAFDYLLNQFSVYFTTKWNDETGEPPTLNCKLTVLGLLLAFYCDKTSFGSLYLQFGVHIPYYQEFFY